MIRKQCACNLRFGHVPRAFNAVADWAGNVSRETQRNVDLTFICKGIHVVGPPPKSVKEAATSLLGETLGMITHHRAGGDR